MANIVVEPEDSNPEGVVSSPESMLVSWVLDRIEPWRDYRDQNYKDKWDEYYRIWRGIWSASDKTRNSERSRLISPATAQAIEVATAEIEEAVFGKGKWFDINDDKLDEQPQDAYLAKSLLEEDFEEAKIENAMSEIFLIGSIYGTGIGKIVIEEVLDRKIVGERVSDTVFSASATQETRVLVRLVPIPPEKFLIDPYATCIDEAMGCAHEDWIPKHSVLKKQSDGIYRPGPLGTVADEADYAAKMESNPRNRGDNVKIIEYHGLVPRTLLEATMNSTTEDEDVEVEYRVIDDFDDLDSEELVEAIITIGNDTVLLKATENKLTMKDRGFVAYQHDTVPNRFHGRGIAEKGYNSQKALDAELRGRIDAMSLTIHPMMGVDATRLIKGTNLEIRPGKSILTSGDPKQVLNPLTFGQVNNNTFSQSGELERMIQMATGAMDSAAPIGVSPRNGTASGMSMIMSGAIKRSKRTLANIESNFIIPLIHKSLWRYQQFDSSRYPIKDIKFRIVSALGIMARELEQQNLANMLKTVSPDSPAYWMLIKNMYQLSSLDNKEEMIQVTDQMLQKALQPDPMQQQAAQLEMQKIQKEIEKLSSEAMLNVAKARAESMQSGEGEAIKAKLDAQLKLQIAQMEDQTKRDIAVMDAQNEMKIALIKAEADAKLKAKELEDKKEMKKKEISIKRANGSTSVSVN